jgi:histidine triad (HIT) family protein
VLVPQDGGPVGLTDGQPVEFAEISIPREGFMLGPKKFVLAATRELLRVAPHLLCSLDGRSTVARLGLFVHCSSSTIDNVTGGRRSIVLELFNAGCRPVILRAGDPVAQVVFSTVSGSIEGQDALQYAGQEGNAPPTTSYAFERRRPVAESSSMYFRHEPPDYDCPFCRLAGGGVTEYSSQEDVLFRNSEVTAFVASHWWPNNGGAAIVAVNQHVENIYELPDELGAAVFRACKVIAMAMKIAYKCDGTSTRQHNEPAGGQDVWHYHMHVFPRTKGDRLYKLDAEKHLAPADVKAHRASALKEALHSIEHTVEVFD